MNYRKKCLIVTAVWGEWHVNALLKLNLRTLLAADNITSFAQMVETTYLFHTPKEDRKKIEASTVFQKLKQIVRVEFSELSDKDIGHPIHTHVKIWDSAVKKARDAGDYVLFMPPDVAWSNGSLQHLGKLILAGKKAIFLNWHLRAIANTFIPKFLDIYGNDGTIVNASSRDLVRLTLEHIHPICGTYLRNSPCFPKHPEMIFWPVRNEGVLMRVLALTPFIFNPRQISLSKTKLVEYVDEIQNLHFVTDSDDLYMVSLAQLGKDADWYDQNSKMDYVSIAKWWTYFDSPMNNLLVNARYRLHYTNCTEENWSRVEQSSQLLVHRLIATRELYRIYLAAKKLNCKLAASIIATALHMEIAPFLIRKLHPLTIFIPSDRALESIWDTIIHPLLQPHARHAFIAYLQSHFVPSSKWKSNSTEVEIIGTPEKVGYHTIYAIKNSLSRNFHKQKQRPAYEQPDLFKASARV